MCHGGAKISKQRLDHFKRAQWLTPALKLFGHLVKVGHQSVHELSTWWGKVSMPSNDWACGGVRFNSDELNLTIDCPRGRRRDGQRKAIVAVEVRASTRAHALEAKVGHS